MRKKAEEELKASQLENAELKVKLTNSPSPSEKRNGSDGLFSVSKHLIFNPTTNVKSQEVKLEVVDLEQYSK